MLGVQEFIIKIRIVSIVTSHMSDSAYLPDLIHANQLLLCIDSSIVVSRGEQLHEEAASDLWLILVNLWTSAGAKVLRSCLLISFGYHGLALGALDQALGAGVALPLMILQVLVSQYGGALLLIPAPDPKLILE